MSSHFVVSATSVCNDCGLVIKLADPMDVHRAMLAHVNKTGHDAKGSAHYDALKAASVESVIDAAMELIAA